MKKLVIGAAFALGVFAATSAHAQTTNPDPATALPQTSQSTQDAYIQQRDQRRLSDQSVADSKRALREQESQTRTMKAQMRAQRQQAKQQKEQLRMERQNAKAAHQQESAAKAQMRAQRKAEKEARKTM